MGKIVKELLKLLAYFYGFFSRILNYRKPRILVFTDSRGFEITKWYNRFSPWNSYIGMLCRNYNVTFVIQPEKHTTIIDFLDYCKEHDVVRYSKIILHCGVVDFSPRPYSDYRVVAENKKPKILKNFEESFWRVLISRECSNSMYNGEKTLPLVDYELAQPIFTKLLELRNLLWIPSNRVLPNWRGNYWRDRPTDINIVWSNSSRLLASFDLDYIDCLKWTDQEIKLYTVDNIHFSSEGMKFLFNRISKSIDES